MLISRDLVDIPVPRSDGKQVLVAAEKMAYGSGAVRKDGLNRLRQLFDPERTGIGRSSSGNTKERMPRGQVAAG